MGTADTSFEYQIPDILLEYIPGYLDRRDDDIETLQSLADNADFPEMRKIAHNLAGSGGSYGFDKITEIGHALLLACREQNISMARHCVNELKEEVRHIRQEIL